MDDDMQYTIERTELQQAAEAELEYRFGDDMTMLTRDNQEVDILSDNLRQVRIVDPEARGDRIPDRILRVVLPSRAEGLFFSGYHIPKLPETFGTRYRKLLALMVRRAGLESLPESIGEIHNLTYLDVSYNELTVFPHSFGNLKLHRLYARNNPGIRVLPGAIGFMPRIIDVVFAECGIRAIHPAFLRTGNNLKILNLSKNQLITARVPWNRLSKMPKLEILKLDGNYFGTATTSLAGGIMFSGNFPRLERLDLSRTQLGSFPMDLLRLPSLIHLRLSGNPLTEIPAEIGTMTSLQELHVDDMETLRQIPRQILDLPRLRVFEARRSSFVRSDRGTYMAIKAMVDGRQM